MMCIFCGEWFKVITNPSGLGINFCPCCGIELTEESFEEKLEGYSLSEDD